MPQKFDKVNAAAGISFTGLNEQLLALDLGG